MCIDKVFKYMQNIQNLIHEAGRILKRKVLFDLLNHVRAACFFKKFKNWPDQFICITFLYRFLIAQESLRAQYKEWKKYSLIHNENRNFAWSFLN